MFSFQNHGLLVGLIILVGLASPAFAFGAGNIAAISKVEGQNWRHGDIEDALLTLAMARAWKGKKFNKIMVSRVYFGNWLRDYSQAIDVGTVKAVSAEAIRLLLCVLGFLTFGFGSGEFEVTADRLGCYRPEDHIDNPKDYAENVDARQYDRRLRGPIDERRELSIDPQTGMKNYIANEQAGIMTSAKHIRQLFSGCIELGRRYKDNDRKEDLYEALRLMGTGLHCLEDFFAHSNYLELALIEMGERDVFPHVGRRTQIEIEGARQPVYPIVTGTFGGVDFLHSVTGEVSDKLTQNEIDELEGTLQDSTTADTSMLRELLDMIPDGIFGDKHESDKVNEIQSNAASAQMQNMSVSPREPEEFTQYIQQVFQQVMPVIQFHDEIMQSISAAVEKIPVLPKIIEQLEEQLSVFVFSIIAPFIVPLIKQIRNELATGSDEIIESSEQQQHIVFNDDNSSDPTHSMLSKDHFSNILNEIAGRSAAKMLHWVVPQIMEAIDDEGTDIDRLLDGIIGGILHHPAQRDLGGGKIREGRRLCYESVKEWWGEMDEDQREDYKRKLTRQGVQNSENHKEGVQDTGHGHGCAGKLKMRKLYGGGPETLEDKIAGAAADAIFSGATGAISGMVEQNTGYKLPNTGRKEEKEEGGLGGFLNAAGSILGGAFGGDETEKQTSRHREDDGSVTKTRVEYGRSGDRYGQAQYTETQHPDGSSQSEYQRYEQKDTNDGRQAQGYGYEERTETRPVHGGGYEQRTERTEQHGSTNDDSYGNRRRDDEGGYGRREESGGYGGGERRQESYGRQQESSYGQQQESSYGRQQESSYGRQQESSYGRQQESSYGQQQESSYGGGGGGYERQQEGGYGRQQEGEYGRQQEAGYGRQEEGSYGRREESGDEYGRREEGGRRRRDDDDDERRGEADEYSRQNQGYGDNNEERERRCANANASCDARAISFFRLLPLLLFPPKGETDAVSHSISPPIASSQHLQHRHPGCSLLLRGRYTSYHAYRPMIEYVLEACRSPRFEMSWRRHVVVVVAVAVTVTSPLPLRVQRSVAALPLLFSNPVWSGVDTVPSTIIRNITALSSQLAYEERIDSNLTTLTTTNADTLNGLIQGLLYVPAIDDTACRLQQYDFIPKNVTGRDNLPPTNYNLIALAPWFSIDCTLAYLASARLDPIRAFVFYKPNNSSNKPQESDSPVWNLDDGGSWLTKNKFPIFAVSGIEGQNMMEQLSLYSGDIDEIPHGEEINKLYGPNPKDYVRVWTELNLKNDSDVPALWAFFLIVIGALLLIITGVSCTMHFIQRRRRISLKRRVKSGEVDLEAMGVKRLTIPSAHVMGFPLFTYNAEPDAISTPPTPVSASSPLSPRSGRGSRSSRRIDQRSVISANSIRSKRSSIGGSADNAATNFQPNCHICLSKFDHRVTVIRELPCGHIFHPECIDEFLIENSSLCPVCKHCMLPRGYSPRITNGMVRRERALRRLRQRVDLDNLSFDFNDHKMKAWGKRLFRSSPSTPSPPTILPLTIIKAPKPNREAIGVSTLMIEEESTITRPVPVASIEPVPEPRDQVISSGPATSVRPSRSRMRPRALKLLPTQPENSALENSESEIAPPAGRGSPSSFARERMQQIAAKNAPFDDPDQRRHLQPINQPFLVSPAPPRQRLPHPIVLGSADPPPRILQTLHAAVDSLNVYAQRDARAPTAAAVAQ
ncbi:hypothetical protein G7046_g9393 [Stylonectria norvegica]|nr:hypothetical protein G7046_g9393 [Stylonectria norvegica]